MAQKKSYNRHFIILQPDESLANSTKQCSGYSKLEVKNEKCKVSFYIQNVSSAKEKLCLILICSKGDTKQLIKVSDLAWDASGKAEVVYEYDAHNIAYCGHSLDSVKGAAVIRADKGIVSKCLMSGFLTTEPISNWNKFQLIEGRNEEEQQKQEQEQRKSRDEIIQVEEIIEDTSIPSSNDNPTIFDQYEEKIESDKQLLSNDIEARVEENDIKVYAESILDINRKIITLRDALNSIISDLGSGSSLNYNNSSYSFLMRTRGASGKVSRAYNDEEKCIEKIEVLEDKITKLKDSFNEVTIDNFFETRFNPISDLIKSVYNAFEELINMICYIKDMLKDKKLREKDDSIIFKIFEALHEILEVIVKEIEKTCEVVVDKIKGVTQFKDRFKEEELIKENIKTIHFAKEKVAKLRESLKDALESEYEELAESIVPLVDYVNTGISHLEDYCDYIEDSSNYSLDRNDDKEKHMPNPIEPLMNYVISTIRDIENMVSGLIELIKNKLLKEEREIQSRALRSIEEKNYPVGSAGEFFKLVVEDFEPYKEISSEIRNCKWFKVRANSIEDLCDNSNKNKYTIAYYPMMNYYPYMKDRGHYLLGLKYNEDGTMKYLVYGIPGTKDKFDQPYGGKTGFVTWVPENDGDTRSEAEGFWLMFYDFRSSTVVIPVR